MDNDALVASFFDKRAEIFGDSIDALDWGSSRTQQLRFALLSEIGKLEGASLLDVGCGLADFYSFFQQKGMEVKYTGVDLSEKLIAIARDKYPGLDLRFANILEENFGEYDYVVGSGIHYLKVENNIQRSEVILKRMFDLCKVGVATNMINAENLSDGALDDHVYAFMPTDALKIARKITKYILLRQDYLPHDFTLYLYRDDYRTRQSLLQYEIEKGDL